MRLFDQQARYAFIIVCVMLGVIWFGFTVAVKALNYTLRKEAVPLREPFSTISRTLGPWQALGEDRVLDAAMIGELGTQQYLDRVYALDGRPDQGVVGVHLAYYTGIIDAVPHVPDRCMVAGGYQWISAPQNLPLPMDMTKWRPDPAGFTNLATGQPYKVVTYRPNDFVGDRVVRMPIGDLELRITEFANPKQPGLRIFSGYLFVANGRATASPVGVRKLAFQLSEKYAYYCKLQLTIGGEDLTAEQFVAQAGQVLEHLLPEVMARLPDWAEVERQAGPSEHGAQRDSG